MGIIIVGRGRKLHERGVKGWELREKHNGFFFERDEAEFTWGKSNRLKQKLREGSAMWQEITQGNRDVAENYTGEVKRG